MRPRCSRLLMVSSSRSTITAGSIRPQRSLAGALHTYISRRELAVSLQSFTEGANLSLLEEQPRFESSKLKLAASTTHPQSTTPIKYCPRSPPSPSYHIPPSILEQAIAAKQYWQWNLFHHVETNERPIRHYCKTKAQAEEVAKLFLQDGYEHLGFDLEWDPKAPKHIDPGMKAKSDCSMLQLANEKRIAIFHLALHSETTPSAIFPPTLAHILTSSSFTKLGVHIRGDMTRLSRCYLPDTPPRCFFELSHLYKVTAFRDQPSLINRKSVAMADLVEKMWGIEMYKDESVRGSDWSKPCGVRQIEYAASDAYAGLQLFHELDRRRRACVPDVAMPAFAEHERPLVEKEKSPKLKKTSASQVVDEVDEEDVEDLETLADAPVKEEEHVVADRVGMLKTTRGKKKPSPHNDERSPAEKAAALERRRVFLQAKFQSSNFKRR